VVRRRASGRHRRGDLTRQLLLDSTVEVLETVPIDDVRLSVILERAGTSSGSLYHHFADFPDLVEQAVALRYTRGLRESLEGVRSLLDSSDAADFRVRAEALFRASATAPPANRLYRVEVMGLVQSRPRLATAVARAQQDVTDMQAELFREFQQRGWMRSDVEPEPLSAFIQAMILGHVVDDVSERHIDDELWVEVGLRAFRALILPD
jgi:AcrR family transcriptional regulator